jgi:hypothetical protein
VRTSGRHRTHPSGTTRLDRTHPSGTTGLDRKLPSLSVAPAFLLPPPAPSHSLLLLLCRGSLPPCHHAPLPLLHSLLRAPSLHARRSCELLLPPFPLPQCAPFPPMPPDLGATTAGFRQASRLPPSLLSLARSPRAPCMAAASGEVGEVLGLDLNLLLPPFLPLSL